MVLHHVILADAVATLGMADEHTDLLSGDTSDASRQ